MRKLISIISLLLYTLSSNAQFTNRVYNSITQFHSLELDNSKNIIVSSHVSSVKTILIKNDSLNQNVLWQKELLDSNYISYLRIFQQNIYVISNINSSSNLFVVLTKLDLNGNYLWSKEIRTTNYNLYIEDILVINQTGDIFLGFNNCGYINSILKLDSLGNFNWCKMYSPANTVGAGIRDLKEDMDGNVLALSGCIINSKFVPFLFTIDLNGNMIWNKFYSTLTSSADRISSLTVDSKKNIYFRADLNSNSRQYIKNSIYKTDSVGNLLWSKYYTFPYLQISIASGLTIDSGDNLYYMGVGSDTLLGLTKKFNFLKINSTNGLVTDSWVDTGYISTLLFPQHLKCSNPDRIIFAGIKNGSGLLASVDSLGGGVCELFSSNVNAELLSISQTTEIFSVIPRIPSISDTTLTLNSINLTSTSFCESVLSVSETNNTPVLEVYPNPFSQEIIINNNSKEEYYFYFCNLLGTEILSGTGVNTINLNTSTLASGIYLYEVRSKSGIIKKGKVIKK